VRKNAAAERQDDGIRREREMRRRMLNDFSTGSKEDVNK
jgi:hypothetical protein